MDKSETLDLGVQEVDTKNKKTLWIIFAIVAVIIIIVLIVSLSIGFGKNTKTPKKGAPTQKRVNLLDEQIIANGVPGSQNVEFSALNSEGYENSWKTANGANYRQVAKLANVKWYNTDSASSIPSDVRGMSFIREGYANPVDPVGKSAVANARAATEVAIARDLALVNTSGGDSAGSRAVKATMPTGYKRGDVVAKGGLMETSTPIPVVVVDGKEILVPGITGLDYYDHFESTALTGGSVDRYARDRDNQNRRGKQYPLTGSYNSKSYYGMNPYKKGVDQVTLFGNTPVGYSDTAVSSYNTDGNSGKGPVTNDDYERIAEACKSRGLTGNALQECQTDTGMAGVNTAYSRNDLVGAYRGYEDSFLLADGISVTGTIAHQLTAAATIEESAEIEYKEEIKKNVSIAVMNNSDVCDPMVIYNQVIGLVDEEDDDTTPESYRV